MWPQSQNRKAVFLMSAQFFAFFDFFPKNLKSGLLHFTSVIKFAKIFLQFFCRFKFCPTCAPNILLQTRFLHTWIRIEKSPATEIVFPIEINSQKKMEIHFQFLFRKTFPGKAEFGVQRKPRVFGTFLWMYFQLLVNLHEIWKKLRWENLKIMGTVEFSVNVIMAKQISINNHCYMGGPFTVWL